MKPLFFLVLLLITSITSAQSPPGKAPAETAPLVIGETFTIPSKVLGEVRRINVYKPPGYAESGTLRLPVLYMPDGGIGEEFLHVAGLVQVSVGNGTMRPFLLVGRTEARVDEALRAIRRAIRNTVEGAIVDRSRPASVRRRAARP